MLDSGKIPGVVWCVLFLFVYFFFTGVNDVPEFCQQSETLGQTSLSADTQEFTGRKNNYWYP